MNFFFDLEFHQILEIPKNAQKFQGIPEISGLSHFASVTLKIYFSSSLNEVWNHPEQFHPKKNHKLLTTKKLQKNSKVKKYDINSVIKIKKFQFHWWFNNETLVSYDYRMVLWDWNGLLAPFCGRLEIVGFFSLACSDGWFMEAENIVRIFLFSRWLLINHDSQKLTTNLSVASLISRCQ